MAESKALARQDMPRELVGLRPSGAYTFDELYRLAQVCHASGMFADTADAAQAMMKIVRGQEMGLPPTTAMTAFDIIQKRLFIKPWVIAAKINACGYGSYRVLTQTPQECTILFRRKYAGEGWADCPVVSYTIGEAELHGLVNRSPHWKASPANMLYQRAMGRGGAMYFPELLAGLQAPPDEEPIPPERHRQNIVDLFGDDPRGSTPVEVDSVTGELRPTGGNAPQPKTVRKAAGASQVASSTTPVTPQSQGEASGNLGHSETKDGFAWVTLRAHKDDDQLPQTLRDAITTALSVDEPATDAEADALAGAILDTLHDTGA